MTTDSNQDHDNAEKRDGIGGFLRNLFSGIPWSECAQEDFERTLDAPDAAVIEIHNANGKIRVVGEDRKDIQMSARKYARAECSDAAGALLDSIDVDVQENGGVLELEVVVPRRWNRHGSVDLLLHVPRELEIHAQTSNGKLCMQGLRCTLHARSSNGSVRVEDVVGDIEITTANAKVVCDCTVGRLVARSSNGKIQVDDHRGALEATTSNGFIHAHVHELSKEGVNLATSNGRIVLELPEHPDAEVDVRVDNGVIRSDFDFEGGTNAGASAPGRVRGRLGRGGSPIKLRTSNGTISLRESSESTDATQVEQA